MDAERAAQIRAMTPDELRRLPPGYHFDDRDESDLIRGMQTFLDVSDNRGRAERFARHLATMTPTQRRRRVDVFLRCPLGCLLVEIYLQKPDTEGQLVFLTAHTMRKSKTFYANGGTADDGMDPDMWAPIACRHGSGQYVLAAAIDLVLFTGLSPGSSRRITDTVTIPSSSPNGTEVSDVPIISGPYARWTPKRTLRRAREVHPK